MQIILKSIKQNKKAPFLHVPLKLSVLLFGSHCWHLFVCAFFQKLSVYRFINIYIISSSPFPIFTQIGSYSTFSSQTCLFPSLVIPVAHSLSRKNSKTTCEVPEHSIEVLSGIAPTPMQMNSELPWLPQPADASSCPWVLPRNSVLFCPTSPW